MIEKAIKKINPYAEFNIDADDISKITWLNGTTPIPVADIKAQIPVVEQEEADAEQAAIDKKASGKQKLKDLGLDDAEIKALTGV